MRRMHMVVPAEGILLQHVRDARAPSRASLGPRAAGQYEAALGRTRWAAEHRRGFALVDAHAAVLATAQRYDLSGTLDDRPVRICGIADLVEHRAEGGTHVRELVAGLVAAADAEGHEVALVVDSPRHLEVAPDGFERLPTTDLVLRVTESPRRGAPMAPVRTGESTDLPFIATMAALGGGPVRFRLDRSADFLQFVLTRKRLLAGLGPAGAREVHFLVVEEGMRPAAYAVISIAGETWTIEECGDHDPTGARIGAILQALIARDPAEHRATILAWLPPGFVPPQVTVLSARPSEDVLMIRSLRGAGARPALAAGEVTYWRNDLL